MATITLNPNSQPIYPRGIIHWRIKLLAQVVPRNITTETPILLGVAGNNGSIIHGIDVHHLGDNIATVVRLWTQQENETSYFLENEFSLQAVSGSSNTTGIPPAIFGLPAILPSGNTGMHLEANESFFCALGTAISSGVIVIVRGGDY